MKAYHKKRLLKLAEHLERGKLSVDRFDFSKWHEKTNCGTAGCAMGECPAVFPKHWHFRAGLFGNQEPALKERPFASVRASGRNFFGITQAQFAHLFIPGYQHPSLYSGKVLGERAKPSAVARNIREFIKQKEQMERK